MKKRSKIVIFIFIGLLLLLIVVFPKIRSLFASSNFQQTERAMPKKEALTVNALILKPTDLSDNFRTKGLLIPDEEVNLSFETSGKITGIYFTEGSKVKAGTLLVTVNDETLQAELRKLKAQLPLLEDRVARQKTLLEREAVSQESYETVSTELEKLKADIALINARIRQTELRAPFDGIIGLRMVSEGSYASPTTIVSKLTKISPLKLEFSVNEKQVNDIKVGMPLTFTVENDLKVYHAKIYALESTLDEKTLSLKVRAIYPNADEKLKPGNSATIEINLQEIHDAIVVPSVSSLVEMGNSYVYLYRNGKAEKVSVIKGNRTSSFVQIVDGLSEGDTLITTGVMQLRNGMEVQLNDIK
jgi:membrane fusion protein (multidrug efflux system)